MIKFIGWALLAFALSLFAPRAEAQACEPAPIGTGTYSHTQDTADGTWSVHFCSDAYSVTPVITAKRRDYRIQWPTPASAAGMTDRQLYRELWRLNATTPLNDPSLAALVAPARAWAAANAPLERIWEVAPNGSYVTRPSYWLASGTTGPVLGTRAGDARVGLECYCQDPATRLRSGSATYCPFMTGQDRVQVAVCRRVQ
jgi:hypothetical protein